MPGTVTWTSTPTLPGGTELIEFAGHQCTATVTGEDLGEAEFFLATGNVLPSGLELTTGGFISGTILDMDLFVPEFAKPAGFKFDEQNYATYGSAKEGTHTYTFVVDAIEPTEGISAAQTHSITITNNWSSDRDQFIREIDNDFFIDGVKVTNEEYLTTMKSRGYFPAT